MGCGVVLVRTQAHDVECVSEDEALDHGFRVSTTWWDIEVEILAFSKRLVSILPGGDRVKAKSMKLHLSE